MRSSVVQRNGDQFEERAHGKIIRFDKTKCKMMNLSWDMLSVSTGWA